MRINFSGTGRNELNKIDDFINEFRSLAVIVGDSTPASMPNLTELLWEEYGLGFDANHKIQDLNNGKLKAAGLTVGYIIVKVNNVIVANVEDFERAIKVAKNEEDRRKGL